MSKKNRYFWLKLNENFFDSYEIEYLMSQKNGEKFVIFYQFLCLETLNNCGNLTKKCEKIEINLLKIIEKKLKKYKNFNENFIKNALNLFENLGLIEKIDNTYQITNFEELAGSEAKVTERVRKHRAQKCYNEAEKKCCDETKMKHKCNTDIDIDIDIDIDKKKKDKKRKAFKPPTFEEVETYRLERNSNVDAQHFIDFYTSKNWFVGKNKMVNWKAAFRTWQTKDGETQNKNRYALNATDKATQLQTIQKAGLL